MPPKSAFAQDSIGRRATPPAICLPSPPIKQNGWDLLVCIFSVQTSPLSHFPCKSHLHRPTPYKQDKYRTDLLNVILQQTVLLNIMDNCLNDLSQSERNDKNSSESNRQYTYIRTKVAFFVLCNMVNIMVNRQHLGKTRYSLQLHSMQLDATMLQVK